jgi:hypothetical protein
VRVYYKGSQDDSYVIRDEWDLDTVRHAGSRLAARNT